MGRMEAPPFTELVAGLDASNPFVGPEAIERTTGRPFRARVGANENAFGMSPVARAAAARAAAHLHWYGDPENYALRADLARLHGVGVDQVLVGAGIDDLLALMIRGFALGGGRAVMPLGSYPTFAYHAATLGAPLDTVAYGADDRVDLDALARQACESEALRGGGAGGDPDEGARSLRNTQDDENRARSRPRWPPFSDQGTRSLGNPQDRDARPAGIARPSAVSGQATGGGAPAPPPAGAAGATLVYLANPDNPSGTWHPVAELRRFLSALPPRCMVALDEAYLDYAPGGAPAVPAFANDVRVMQLRTFSKAHGMAGARVGYAVCAAAVAAGLDKLRLQFGVNRVAQEAARASLTDTAFVAGVVRQVAEGRAAYRALARSLDLPTLPSATNFVSFDLGTRERADAVMAALIGRGVFVRKPPLPPLDRCIRLTVGTPAERAIVAVELARVLGELPATRFAQE